MELHPASCDGTLTSATTHALKKVFKFCHLAANVTEEGGASCTIKLVQAVSYKKAAERR